MNKFILPHFILHTSEKVPSKEKKNLPYRTYARGTTATPLAFTEL